MVKIIYSEETSVETEYGPRPADTENELFGDGWVAIRKHGQCILDSASADHGGGSIIYEISEEEFMALKSDHQKWSEIFNKYHFGRR